MDVFEQPPPMYAAVEQAIELFRPPAIVEYIQLQIQLPYPPTILV